MESNTKRVLEDVTNNKFTPEQIEKLYGEVLRNVPREDALQFRSINPNANPLTLSPERHAIIRKQLEQLSPDVRSSAQEESARRSNPVGFDARAADGRSQRQLGRL